MLDKDEKAFLDTVIREKSLYFGRDKIWFYLRDNYPDRTFSRRDIVAYLAEKSAWQMTKQAPKPEPVSTIDVIKRPGYMSADLTGPFVQDFKMGAKYLAGFLDVATKQLYIKGIREKTPTNVVNALKEITAEHNLNPTIIQTDFGGEFKAEFLEYLQSQGIKHFNSQVHMPNQNNIERYWGTLKRALRRRQMATGEKVWLEPCYEICKAMNNTYQRTIRTVPNQALDLPMEVRMERLRNGGKVKRGRVLKTAFKVNDIVRKRILKTGKYEKATITFSEKTYIVTEVLPETATKIVRYKLMENDGTKKLLVGTYAVTELLLVETGGGVINRWSTQQENLQSEDVQVGIRSGPAVRDEVELQELEENTEAEVPQMRETRNPGADREGEFLVERILRRQKAKGKWLYLVKWMGWKEEDATWEPASSLVNAKEILDAFNATRPKAKR